MENDVKKVLLTLGVMSEIKQGHKSFMNEQESPITISNALYTYPKVWTMKSRGVLTSGGRMNPNSEKVFAELMKQVAEDPKRGMCTFNITSGNDTFHQNKKKENPNYNSRHLTGEAIDVTTSESCRSFLKNWLDQYKNYKKGFSYLDEYAKPSRESSGGHFHLSFNSTSADPEIQAEPDLATDSSSDSEISSSGDEDIVSSMLGGTLDKLTKPFREKLTTNLANKFTSATNPNSLSEQFDLGDGKIIKGKFIIPANSGFISSPIKGKISAKQFCNNQILIRSENDDFYLLYCNMTNISKHSGNVYQGTKLGSSSEDVEVSLLSNKFKLISLGSAAAYSLLSKDTDDEGNTKTRRNTSSSYSREKEIEYYEPLVPSLVDLITYPFRKKKETKEQDYKKYSEILKNKKLEENLQRIKKLLN
jgi:hypothetical protein